MYILKYKYYFFWKKISTFLKDRSWLILIYSQTEGGPISLHIKFGKNLKIIYSYVKGITEKLMKKLFKQYIYIIYRIPTFPYLFCPLFFYLLKLCSYNKQQYLNSHPFTLYTNDNVTFIPWHRVFLETQTYLLATNLLSFFRHFCIWIPNTLYIHSYT